MEERMEERMEVKKIGWSQLRCPEIQCPAELAFRMTVRRGHEQV